MTTRRNIAALGSIMNVLYAELLVVVGIAVPVTTSLNRKVPVAPDQVTDDIVRSYVYPPFTPCLVSFLYALSIYRKLGDKLKSI